MVEILSATGLYNLKNSKFIRAELCAYQRALQLVEEEIFQLKNNAFPALCDVERVKEYERMLGIPIDESIEVNNRRKMIDYRCSIVPSDCNKAGLLRAIFSAGMDANIMEDYKKSKIILGCNALFSAKENYYQIIGEILKLMPAHLNVEIDIGLMDWTMFEQKQLSFSELDAEEFTWQYFDLSGHLLGGEHYGK